MSLENPLKGSRGWAAHRGQGGKDGGGWWVEEARPSALPSNCFPPVIPRQSYIQKAIQLLPKSYLLKQIQTKHILNKISVLRFFFMTL